MIVAAVAWSPVVAARPQADVSAEAQRRFDEGKSLLRAQRTEEACDAFAASDALEPGVGVMMVLAACHELLGRFATAEREFLIAAERARAAGDRREASARAGAAELALRVGVLVVRADGPAGVRASRDDVPVELGARLRVDPGEHRLVATAPGHVARSVTVTVASGETKEIVLPTLDPIATTTSTPPPPLDQPAARSGAAQRVLGWIAIGVGGAGIALGAGAGLSALGQKADLEEDPGCPDTCRDEDAVDAYNGARTISTIGFLAGAAVLASGIVVVLTAPDGDATGLASARVTLGPSGAVVTGGF